jgi:UDP-N-acetylglucosamine transferase subunit ALG13
MEKKMDRNTLKALLLCAAKNDVRTYLNSVWFEPGFAYATDGHRLLVVKDESVTSSGYIPRDKVAAMVKVADNSEMMQFGNGIASMGGISTKLTTDHKPIDWRMVVPKAISGEAGQFNATYAYDFQKVAELLAGHKHSHMSIAHNGNGAALVSVNNSNAIGVLMPMKVKNYPVCPGWIISTPTEEQTETEEQVAA